MIGQPKLQLRTPLEIWQNYSCFCSMDRHILSPHLQHVPLNIASESASSFPMASFPNPLSSSRFSSFTAATSASPSSVFPISPSLRLSSSSLCLNSRCLSLSVKASLSDTSVQTPGAPKVLLEVKNLTAVIAESKLEILKGINLVVHEGEVHAIMGKNGSGKSTFSKVLVGHPDYEVTRGSMMFKGENLLDMEPEDRSLAGLFMTFQSPVEIPGVSNIDFLHMAWNARRRKQGLPELGPIEFYSVIYPKLAAVKMDTSFLNRNVNEGFSGGERKRNEILQLAVLGADLAILDEIDSGLDIDAFQDVAKAINGLLTPNNSILVVTHYRRLLDYIKPMYVHIMDDGRIVKTGDILIADQLEKEGYKAVSVV